jgi:hypothetical protein
MCAAASRIFMQEVFSRWFRIVIGVVGALSSGGLVVSGLRGGSMPDFGRASLALGRMYRVASEPSQFWFIVCFWIVACAGFVWLAWSAYRD